MTSEPYKTLSGSAAGSGDLSVRLEEREETLEAILDNLGEGVLATDLRDTPLFANPAKQPTQVEAVEVDRQPKREPQSTGWLQLQPAEVAA